MKHRQILLSQAARQYGISEAELKTLAVQGEIPAFPRKDTLVFFQDDIDLWYSEHIIQGKMSKDIPSPLPPQAEQGDMPMLSALCPPECISVSLKGVSRASIIRSLVELADASGFLYDPKDLEEEITHREEQGSTNIGNGVAVPHTLIREEGYFSQSFLCLARLAKPAYFNSSPDGSATEFLLLSCATSSEEHLRILARISQLCSQTDFLEQARLAETACDLQQALYQAEKALDGSAGRRSRK